MKDSLELYAKRQYRGQVSTRGSKQNSDLSVKNLLELMHSSNAQERTIGATIIGDSKLIELTLLFCDTLRTETHLYLYVGKQ